MTRDIGIITKSHYNWSGILTFVKFVGILAADLKK
jgi:hypothetical protein